MSLLRTLLRIIPLPLVVILYGLSFTGFSRLPRAILANVLVAAGSHYAVALVVSLAMSLFQSVFGDVTDSLSYLWLFPLLITTATSSVLFESLWRSLQSDEALTQRIADGGFGAAVSLWTAGVTGRTPKMRVFRPVHPAGNEAHKAWTTVGSYIYLTDNLATRKIPNFGLWNGSVCLSAWFPFPCNVSCVRNNKYYVTYEISPFQSNNLDVVTAPSLIVSSSSSPFVVRMEHYGEGGYEVHLSYEGAFQTITVSNKVWETVKMGLQVSGKQCTAYTVGNVLESTVTGLTKEHKLLMQGALASYWNNVGFTTPRLERAHQTLVQFVGDRRDDVHAPYKVSGRTVLPKMVTTPNVMPAKGRQADLSAVHYRIDMVRNKKGKLEEQVHVYMDEFLGLIAPPVLEPWTVQDVMDNQTGTLQRIRNLAASYAMGMLTRIRCSVEAMIKVEAIANSGPMRNISTVDPEFNLALGRYMLPAAAWLKANHPWYTAGNSPTVIAQKIVQLANRSMQMHWDGVTPRAALCCADVSKMDAAKHPEITAHLTSKLYFRMFPDSKELVELRQAEAAAPARTAEGLPYKVGASQLSGSACTTIDNTITNAFMSFVAYRLDNIEPAEAFSLLGVYVGDDSVSHNTKESIEAAGALLGYTVKADMVCRGEQVPFLSRFFYACWDDEGYSYQDPLRLLSKLHLSVAPSDIPDVTAALNKMKGLHELDPAIPLYQMLYHKLVEITGRQGEVSKQDGPWYTITYGSGESWPTSRDAADLWQGVVNVTPSRYAEWLSKIETYDDLMTIPPPLADNEHKVKVQLSIVPDEAFATVPQSVSEPPPEATVDVAAGPGVEAAKQRAEAAVKAIHGVAEVEKISRRRERKENKKEEIRKKKEEKQGPPLEVGHWDPKDRPQSPPVSTTPPMTRPPSLLSLPTRLPTSHPQKKDLKR